MRNPVAVALLLAAAPALARPPERAKVERLLSGYEPRPIGPELRRLGDGVDEVLIAIARDPKTRPVRRARALAALGQVPTLAGRDACRGVIRDESRAASGPEVLDVAACARTLGAFGPQLQMDLAPLLAHPAPDVRAAAAEGLATAHAKLALPLLEHQLDREKDPAVRATLTKSIDSIKQSPK